MRDHTIATNVQGAHLVQNPHRSHDIVKATQVSGPAGGELVGRHLHADLRVVVGGVDDAWAVAVVVRLLAPVHLLGHARM